MTRPTPVPGTYGCVAGSGVPGWVIEHGTASPYGHSFIVLDANTVMEARPSGAGPARLDKYLHAGAVFNDEEPLDAAFLVAVTRWAAGQEGAKYDWPAIFDLAGRVVGAKSPLLPVGTHGKYICSQFVTVGYTACGKVMFPAEDRWTISPRLLADRVTTRVWETAA